MIVKPQFHVFTFLFITIKIFEKTAQYYFPLRTAFSGGLDRAVIIFSLKGGQSSTSW